jgi:hypothetical protein
MKLKFLFLFLDGEVSVSFEVEDSVSVEVRNGQLHTRFTWYSADVLNGSNGRVGDEWCLMSNGFEVEG